MCLWNNFLDTRLQRLGKWHFVSLKIKETIEQWDFKDVFTSAF